MDRPFGGEKKAAETASKRKERENRARIILTLIHNWLFDGRIGNLLVLFMSLSLISLSYVIISRIHSSSQGFHL